MSVVPMVRARKFPTTGSDWELVERGALLESDLVDGIIHDMVAGTAGSVKAQQLCAVLSISASHEQASVSHVVLQVHYRVNEVIECQCVRIMGLILSERDTSPLHG
jgi:hypothetical protein